MEDLLSLATELMENDNYKKNDFAEVPDGEYFCNIDKVELRESQSGNQYFSFTNTILDGEYAERKIFVNLFLTDKTIKRTFSSIMNLISSCGYDIDASMFADFDTLNDCLQTLVNNTITINKKTNGEFVNYRMTGGAE